MDPKYISPSCRPQIPTPIDSLPTELLAEIFAYCSHSEALSLIRLSTTRRFWREIILWTPRLWRFISVEDCRLSSDHQAKLWIERSFPLTFDVEINLTSTDTPLALLSVFLSSIARWRSLTLTGKRSEYVDMSIYDRTCLLLSHMDITVEEQDLNSTSDDSNDEDVAIFPFLRSSMTDAPFYMKVNISSFPDPNLLTAMQFTSITINETTGMAASIIHFLRACPSLHFFCLTGCQDNQPSHAHAQAPIVHLPFLRTLKLKNVSSARIILSSIHTPALITLCLAYLNVAFQLWHENDYHEEGDSDDEANDFSQSPSSDRATGMGLRSLIQRSKPPLRSLEMNYSDMRTKDFKYLFDRLPTLMTFAIVASDMSDKVIDLLRPIRLKEEAEEEGGRRKPSMRVRLPRLRILELYNCQRLSGQAVIDALVERVNFTNPAEHTYEVSSEANGARLEEVLIAGCDGFNSGHAFMLANDIGDRIAFQHT